MVRSLIILKEINICLILRFSFDETLKLLKPMCKVISATDTTMVLVLENYFALNPYTVIQKRAYVKAS